MEHKIAIIICANDEAELNECFYYLGKLNIPHGFELEVLTISDATSMAAGYQEGMESSDAKYKIYIHQDTRLVYENILTDIIDIFCQDETIGMIGCIGAKKLPEDAYAVNAWDVGKVYHNYKPRKLIKEEKADEVIEVEAIDGLFIATQYDINWRSDIFDGWDFYDISQCQEFIRQGKKVVIPYQKEIWCYHDNKSSSMKNYNKYRELFLQEYKGQVANIQQEAYTGMKEQIINSVHTLLEYGNIEGLAELFSIKENQRILFLKDYEIIAEIHRLECQNLGDDYFYQDGCSAQEMLDKVKRLKRLLKRIEFGKEVEEHNKILHENYTEYAVEVVRLGYS